MPFRPAIRGRLFFIKSVFFLFLMIVFGFPLFLFLRILSIYLSVSLLFSLNFHENLFLDSIRHDSMYINNNYKSNHNFIKSLFVTTTLHVDYIFRFLFYFFFFSQFTSIHFISSEYISRDGFFSFVNSEHWAASRQRRRNKTFSLFTSLLPFFPLFPLGLLLIYFFIHQPTQQETRIIIIIKIMK